jgi:hypothetical protein
MTHGRGPQAPAILESLAAAPQAQQMWRDLMTAIQYFWRHPLAEQVRAEGREEGREEGRTEGREQGRVQECRQMILRILEWRAVPVTDAARERVTSCTDLDQLEAWAQRAVHAEDAAELFDAR